MNGTTCPNTPAELFDGTGLPRTARPILYFGLTTGTDLPCALIEHLDGGPFPYRVIPVAAAGHLALYGPDRVVTGVAPILRQLREMERLHRAR
jgi:hypothetical protein